ncbi:MAG TPA: penicillin-binding transpeptidase domain-containing protein [Candidatus Babeliales bacterium]|nr:penicillin-binding transpeptidase domain-containing protein [Candidatus Babeliales bacterium]
MQIHLSNEYLIQSTKNYSRLEQVTSPRGNITDAYGNLLVTNRPIVHIYWQGAADIQLNQATRDTLHNLGQILEQPFLENDTVLTQIKRANRYCQKIRLASDITFEQLSKIKEQFPNHPAIIVGTDFERFYPHNSYASHILGYLGRINVESIGQMGLEKLHEDALKGNPGIILKTINSLGANLVQLELKKALSGSTIQTTIDLPLQNLVEQIFPEDVAGTIVIMNPADGALRAIVSRPNFNPNIFLHPITAQNWNSLQKNQPFLNRAFKACYPPGSIFKLITISAALEQRLIQHSEKTCCRGYLRFGGRKYWCSNRDGHGELSIHESIAKSCNILFFKIGKKIDIDLLHSYANKFGLGTKTGITFSEEQGLIPSRLWKKTTKNESWWQGETLSVTIGQSFLQVTPIQVARMIGSIFTGYLVTPRILLKEPVVKQPLDISPETRQLLRETMELTIQQGTGQSVKNIRDITIHAKTSTAQTSCLSKRELGTQYLEHGWFVSHISYKHHDPIILIILLENVGSSRVATRTAKDLLLGYKKLMDQTR